MHALMARAVDTRSHGSTRVDVRCAPVVAIAIAPRWQWPEPLPSLIDACGSIIFALEFAAR
jgi:hypothetical protein